MHTLGTLAGGIAHDLNNVLAPIAMGLQLVSAIVRNHGGFIEMESGVGKGTTFSIYFPALPGKQDDIVRDAAAVLPAGDGELILVVDDEAAVREIAKVTLESFGYRTVEAANGAEAIALYVQRKEEIRLIISDMDMPVMNGATMIRVLEQINPEIRVISASGMISLSKAHAPDISLSPFRVILPKPFTAAELLRTVQRVLKAA
jgi:CheY-like chemotaxis protein